MNCIEDIIKELLSIQQQLSTCTYHIDNSKNEILEEMNRIQNIFGDQTAGQNIVLSLSEALKSLVCADTSLYELKSGMNGYIGQIKQ